MLIGIQYCWSNHRSVVSVWYSKWDAWISFSITNVLFALFQIIEHVITLTSLKLFLLQVSMLLYFSEIFHCCRCLHNFLSIFIHVSVDIGLCVNLLQLHIRYRIRKTSIIQISMLLSRINILKYIHIEFQQLIFQSYR